MRRFLWLASLFLATGAMAADPSSSQPLDLQKAIGDRIQRFPASKGITARDLLDEARSDVEANRYQSALEKFRRYYESVPEKNPSMIGPRADAFREWYELGTKYPPAMEALKSAREDAGRRAVEAENPLQTFYDFMLMNRELDEELRTVEMFQQLAVDHPLRARQIYAAAEPALIRAKKYELCGKFIDPKAFDNWLIFFEADQKIAGDGFGHNGLLLSRRMQFTSDTKVLVALLVLNGQRSEADRIAQRARRAVKNTTFHRELDEALAGKVPDRWPPPRRSGNP
jgi:hypothetical protein